MARCQWSWVAVCCVVVSVWISCVSALESHVEGIQDTDLSDKDKKSWQSESDALHEGAMDLADLDLEPEEVKRKWSNNMRVWGKRSDKDSDDDKRAWNNNMRVWGKRDYHDLVSDLDQEKRQWGSNGLRVWGKRQPSKNWGQKKRDDDSGLADKRQWGQSMRVWGKRAGSLELNDPEVKRKWDNLMKVWGKRNQDKRAWNNAMRVWGKRNDGELSSESELIGEEGLAGDADKKAWNNNMRVWGKRSIAKRSIEDIDDVKRAWNTDSMRVWGKRRNPDDGPKRSWKTNTMRVWGKRSYDTPVMADGLSDSDLDDWNKRTWKSSSLRTWGKRAVLDAETEKLINSLYR